jgi:CRISPR-associated endonuclease/helicase Cas3
MDPDRDRSLGTGCSFLQVTTSNPFWAKTTSGGLPGISVHDHCLNVGCVAEAMIELLPDSLKSLLPLGAATLAALHDIGKITAGFQSKCPTWNTLQGVPSFAVGEIDLSVSDHSLVSQVFLQGSALHFEGRSRLWPVAVGAHHGRPKGRAPSIPFETKKEWAEAARFELLENLKQVFGKLPTTPPKENLSDLWLLAGLISVADWIGSNESWFDPCCGTPLEVARYKARKALSEIGWPGGKLRQTSFSQSFSERSGESFEPNPVQKAVIEALKSPGIVIVEGPMGCGKTEAALFAAQTLIAEGHHHGIYFALPTQVTSNRIHKRIASFLRNTLIDSASLRLVHGSAWLEDKYDLLFTPSFEGFSGQDHDDPKASAQEARSWFASAKQALLAPYGVGTVDQALQSIVAVKHFFVRRFALAGKVVIIDEVHSYDIYTGTLITTLIRELVGLGCSVIILSATLTNQRRRELLEAADVEEVQSTSAYPLITSGVSGAQSHEPIAPDWPNKRPITLRVEVIPFQDAIRQLIARAHSGQNVLWIRNTVVEAQEAYRVLRGECLEGVDVGLLHSRFPFIRRTQIEEEWLERLGKNRPAVAKSGSILVATQVVEQSVDIDLDFIVSDLAPTDMLLQRVGRLWRHPREDRAADAPEFWVRLPELSENGDAKTLCKSLGRSARVYAPYVLLRSAKVWEDKTILNIPSDIRGMIEATYADPDENENLSWQELHRELEAEKATLSANAEAVTRVLGNPTLNDGEVVLTRAKGTPTKSVLLLRSFSSMENGSVRVVTLNGTTEEISGSMWRRTAAKFLNQWMVRIPLWMVPQSQTPDWVTLNTAPGVSLVLVDCDGACSISGQNILMTYDDHLGISNVSHSDQLPLTPKTDDESDL